ncbi:hypothetical protein [Cryptosporangium aurantiacum]|uniref:Uncharacterized protein n=1 Tax=Cryptosporangium aurantiacum TaxID=134849 RepID=A0A1M7MRF7_9ACTN|nr:hypothetical protein [Cryptosporangium aurantiacum]SHM93126.1 hypothetical protein SAMN05443668_102219 [Cryptosporangium aurantiacum]
MTAVAAPTLPPSLRKLGRHRAPSRGPRLAVAAALLAGAATFTLAASGGVTTLPAESPALSAVSQTVTTGVTGPLTGRSVR